jgi:hypothetical protein
MIPDRDIYAAANLMVKRHGDDATAKAEARAEELGAEGNLDGQRVWLAIVKAIEVLQRPAPADGEKVH